ncbi:MAG TPA: DNA primase [Actinomycetales bacterium]|nr:DNA primase [Actinomycetales bacterium]
MAGLIRREDVDAVRERSRIEEVVGEHVTLRPAGVGSLKGLCPFHDERSPSFHVRPQVGFYHCFGCGEGGDVFTFLQKIDHLTFAEAVERLAAKAGIQLRYEDGGGPRRDQDPNRRQRLLDAHRVAEEFYREQLNAPHAAPGRRFLAERGFDQAAAEQFGVGFAPQGWDALTRHLRGRGFTDAELVTSGLLSAGSGRGPYDRFRGRLVWPIRDITGATVGFGARKLLEEDQGPKYLNTPETPIYRKSQVLYGVDLAKRDIARRKQVVVVEGYTDVMACHLSGVPTAVATCGTAFGADHIKIVRRLLVDDDAYSGEVVFTFDGDQAGQKAALRAFEQDQRFVAQTFVAVESHGLDPCDLRQTKGPEAVQALVASRQPLFEFAIRTTLDKFDLDTAEGRVAGLRAAAPVVAAIRDPALRPEYSRQLAGWLGMDVEDVRSTVARAGRAQPALKPPTSRDHAVVHGQDGSEPSAAPQAPPPIPRPDPRDPVARTERQVLEVVLQVPHLVPAQEFSRLDAATFTAPAYRAVHDAIVVAGGPPSAPDAGWAERVRAHAPSPISGLVTELAVAPIPANDVARYARGIVLGLRELQIGRAQANLHSRLQRAEPEEQAALQSQLMELEQQRRALRED